MARTSIATDNFNRADGNLGSDWLDLNPTYSSAEIVGNKVDGSSDHDNAAIWVGARADEFTNDQYSSVVIGGLSYQNIENQVGAVVRAAATQDALRNYYVFYMTYNGDGPTYTTRLSKYVNGVETILATGSVAWTNGDRIEAEAVGSNIRGCKNGALVSGFSITNTTFSTGTPGIYVKNANVSLDDADLGSVTSSVTATGAGASDSSSASTATGIGGAAASGAGISDSASASTGSGAGTAAASGTGITDTASASSGSATGGTANATGLGVSDSATASSALAVGSAEVTITNPIYTGPGSIFYIGNFIGTPVAGDVIRYSTLNGFAVLSDGSVKCNTNTGTFPCVYNPGQPSQQSFTVTLNNIAYAPGAGVTDSDSASSGGAIGGASGSGAGVSDSAVAASGAASSTAAASGAGVSDSSAASSGSATSNANPVGAGATATTVAPTGSIASGATVDASGAEVQTQASEGIAFDGDSADDSGANIVVTALRRAASDPNPLDFGTITKHPSEVIRLQFDFVSQLATYWRSRKLFATGIVVRPIQAIGIVLECIQGGETGFYEPLWPRTIDAIRKDGGVIWKVHAAANQGIDAIASASVSADAGFGIVGNAGITARDVRQTVSGGTTNTDYQMTIEATTESGKVVVGILTVAVRSKIASSI